MKIVIEDQMQGRARVWIAACNYGGVAFHATGESALRAVNALHDEMKFSGESTGREYTVTPDKA